METYKKIDNTTLEVTKETSIKHNIPALKKEREVKVARIAEIDKILAEAEKLGII